MKKTKHGESRAFQAGIDAYGRGLPRFKCPHLPDSHEARDWLAGCDEAARMMREEGNRQSKD